MLRGGIEQVSIDGLQQSYNEAMDILGKIATVVEKKDAEGLQAVYELANDVNVYFNKIARFEGVLLDVKCKLSRKRSDFAEVINDMIALRGKWSDPQYEEFEKRAFAVIQKINPLSFTIADLKEDGRETRKTGFGLNSSKVPTSMKKTASAEESEEDEYET